MENEKAQENPATPSRFVHIHAGAVNERIHEALGTKKRPVADSRMNAAHFFAGPHCVFFAK
jgi:hypothetical protein